MSPPAPAPDLPALRRPTLGERLPPPRRRPLLVRLYASLLSDFGLLGRPSRRRAAAFLARSLVPAVAVLCAALVGLGAFAAPRPGWIQAGALAALAAALAGTVYRRTLGAAEGLAAPLREQLELGSLFVVAAYATAQAVGLGHGDSPLQPLVYLVMAFLVAFLSRAAGFALVGLAVGLEALVWWGRGAHGGELAAAIVHGGFVALFAALYHAVLVAHLAAGRRSEEQAVSRRLAEIARTARELRLLAPTGGEHPEDEWTAAAVLGVEAAVRGALEVTEAALRAESCAVWFLSPDDRQLRLSECRSTADVVSGAPLPAGEGVLGAVVKTRRPVRLHGDMKPPGYRLDGGRPGALLAVPIVEPEENGGHVRGVLLAERAAAEPFGDVDERVLLVLGAEVLRAAHAERYVASMRRARDEKVRFFEALKRLNQTAKPAEVFDATFEAVRSVVPVDVAALTLTERRGEKRVHRIVRASGDEAVVRTLEGREWPDEAGGLVVSAIRHGSSLPGKDLERAPIFDPETRLKGVTSLRVVTLRIAGDVIGTLVVGSRRPEAYGLEHHQQLDVIAMQAAASIERARLFEQTERLATTDGLTGLLNHRTFQARLDEALAQAHRYGKRAALLLCDIDHFKSVNDTYGHPIGDVVLRGVAQTLAREARNTDLVARYGGEEFAILMPETDAAGALVIAERIRERVAAQAFDTGQGPLKVTLSLGVASYPDEADRKATLVERADACLYQAKRSGRNRAVSAAGQPAGRARATA